MGLVICKKILHKCGGSIDVFSAGEDEGTTFLCQIHMAAQSAPRPALNLEQKTQSGPEEVEIDADSSRVKLVPVQQAAYQSSESPSQET